MKRVRWPILIALFAAIFVAVAWQRAKNDMPIEFLDGAPKVGYISREALETKPKIDFKVFGKRIRYPEPIENVLLPLDMETGPGYLDFRSTQEAGPIAFEDANGRPFYGSSAYFLAPITGSPTPLASRSLVNPRRRVIGELDSQNRLVGFPFATDEKFRDAALRVGTHRYPIRLPVSPDFGPAQRQPTSASFGSWKLSVIPKPWRYTTVPFEVDVRIDGPNATFLYPKSLQVNTNFEIGRTGETETQAIRFLPAPVGQRAEIIRVSEEAVELIVHSAGPGLNNLKLATGEPVFDWKSGIPWDNKSVVAVKCLNILAFHSSGFSEVDSMQKLDTLKNGDRVKGTIYRVLERFRVDIPVDIPPLLTKPFMRDR